MKSFFISSLNAHLRYQDLPGNGLPIIFIHGLGCASSYEYPRVGIATDLQRSATALATMLGLFLC